MGQVTGALCRDDPTPRLSVLLKTDTQPQLGLLQRSREFSRKLFFIQSLSGKSHDLGRRFPS